LKVDINNPAALDFLIGERWYEFLARCRAVLGVEGGASVLDRDGSVRERVEAYVADHPEATFEETRSDCFPGRDLEIHLACLSPRHLEACVTRTCQLLLEGSYSGVLRPWAHYIPIKSDYSNVDEVLDALEDDALAERIVNQAYEDVVASGKWSYRSFVQDIEETIIDRPPSRGRLGPAQWPAYMLLRLRAVLVWKVAHWEASKVVRLCRKVAQWGRARAVRIRSVAGLERWMTGRRGG
jgi:hypothetical protein